MRRAWIIICSLGLVAARAAAFDALLPDPALSPGRIAMKMTERAGVTPEMMDNVFARYRIPLEERAQYRIDHVIPKELGGADAVANLWPQKLNARPYGPDRKDLLTRRMCSLVAERRLTLQQAQREIAEDWVSAYVVHIGMIYLAPAAGQLQPRD